MNSLLASIGFGACNIGILLGIASLFGLLSLIKTFIKNRDKGKLIFMFLIAILPSMILGVYGYYFRGYFIQYLSPDEIRNTYIVLSILLLVFISPSFPWIMIALSGKRP